MLDTVCWVYVEYFALLSWCVRGEIREYAFFIWVGKMSKKKRQNTENDIDQDYGLDEEMQVDPSVDEDEDGDEREAEDEFAEDESDLALLRSLEMEERTKALATFSFAEELGFNPEFDWSTVSEAEQGRFQALMENTAENIESMSWKRLEPMQRWMIARAAMKHGLHALFREIANNILKTRKKIPELCLEDIYLELVRDYVETKEFDEAFEMLAKFEQAFPQEQESLLRVKALVHFAKGENDEGKALIEEMIKLPFNRNIPGFEKERVDYDVEKRESTMNYEVAAALYSLGLNDRAKAFLDKARNFADMNEDYELIMEIDNMQARILRKKDGLDRV